MYFSPENRAVCKIMGGKKYGRFRQSTDDSISRCMRVACWINKAADTHSDYITPIAFPRQQRLRERVSLLCSTYISSLVYFSACCFVHCKCAAHLRGYVTLIITVSAVLICSSGDPVYQLLQCQPGHWGAECVHCGKAGCHPHNYLWWSLQTGRR